MPFPARSRRPPHGHPHTTSWAIWDNGMNLIKMYHRFKKDKNNLARWQAVIEDFNPLLQEAVDRTPQDAKLLDPTDLLTTIARKHGKFGIDVASEMLIGINQEFHRSPWTLMRTVEWEDERELRDLFFSENLATNYGIFFDQRFIDYLQTNFDKIDVMNWRQFEGLAAEHLVRQGFSIDLGPGRNDDGVDIRVFPAEAREGLPPTTIVQCKRERRKISKVVVKSLWADVQHEGAESGLIVTTTELSPGAAKVCKVRNYPIGQANRNMLRHWISKMRTPGAGVFG
jgi:restriction system protein